MNNGKILIIDDEISQREILKKIFEKENYLVKVSENGKKAIEIFKEFEPEVILLDLKLPDMDGIEVMEKLKEISEKSCEFIIITGHGTIESAVEAIKKGAFDYITKPIELQRLIILVERALEKISLLNENILLKKQLEDETISKEIIGISNSLKEVLRLTKILSPLDVTVLLLGETGTGKGLIAKTIHYLSKRRRKIFQTIDCATIPETLLESEIFGYEKGAFTGAFTRKEGIVELANNGTLFLDEIAELPTNLQSKLLRLIEEKRFRRIGGKEEILVDVRIISATNKDLEKEIEKGKFREDLYYRLKKFSIKIPPLRERKEDIIPLAKYFLEKFNKAYNKNIEGFSKDATDALLSYSWPGNVRELQSFIENAVVLCQDKLIQAKDLNISKEKTLNLKGFQIPPEGINLKELEKEILKEAMEKSGWVVSRAAKLLGVTYRTLQYRLKKYKIEKCTKM